MLETCHFTSKGHSDPAGTQDVLNAESRDVTGCSEDRHTEGLAWCEGKKNNCFLREDGKRSFGARESEYRGYRAC